MVVGTFGLFYPQALGVGYEAVTQVLQGDFLFSTALVLLIAKLLVTGSCVGSGVSGGIFAPSLFLGAMLGALFGDFSHYIWPDSTTLFSHFALVGMGAMVAGATLAPITAILTIFELTYNYEIILRLMVACIPSIIVVRILHGFSIYETRLLMQGIRIVKGHDANRLRAMKIRDYVCTDHTILPVQTPLADILEQMLKSSFPHFMIEDKQGALAGVLTLRDVRAFLNKLVILFYCIRHMTFTQDVFSL
jgi:CIC family chloride channel protein